MMHNLLLTVLLLCCVKVSAQTDTLNQLDENGMKQGYWIIFGIDKPEKGYPADGKIEEGTYKDGRKNGLWVKYHPDGKTPKLKAHFINNRPNGEYWKYFKNEFLREHGRWKGGKNVLIFEKYYNSGCLEFICEDSIRTYYQDNCSRFGTAGRIDTLRGSSAYATEITRPSQINPYPSDIKEMVIYDSSGAVMRVYVPDSTKQHQQTIPTYSPDGWEGQVKGNQKFKPNGYNKLYNKDDELWMDGEFKNGKLWNGKLYIYDNDGILTKIEIWKNGKYHSDGQL